jgi:hypothetical protein
VTSVRVARIFLLAALFVAYGTGSFAQSSALVAPLDPQRFKSHPAKLDSAQKKTSVIDAHHPVN